jgi:dTDP-4-amino-4,6-dideoxygalactose transaminase
LPNYDGATADSIELPGTDLIFPHSYDALIYERRHCARLYREAHVGCSWIKAQHVPEGWTHDYWTYAVALESAELWQPFTEAIVRHGGEMPYGAWRITYQEPAFRHLAEDGTCPIAEDLQPRLVQFQTNSLESARTNADAVAKAIAEIG